MSRRKRVKCVETGEEFPSLQDAGTWLGLRAKRKTMVRRRSGGGDLIVRSDDT